VRKQHLPAVAGGADARGAMDADADVVVRGRYRFAGMQAHPHAQRSALWPGMIVQRALRGDRAADRVLHAAEGDEKSIAGGAELMAVMFGNRIAEDAAVFFECFVISLRAQLRQSGRRVLDVAEEERDGARGFGGHGIIGRAAKRTHTYPRSIPRNQLSRCQL
jgi:hypothetical protein